MAYTGGITFANYFKVSVSLEGTTTIEGLFGGERGETTFKSAMSTKDAIALADLIYRLAAQQEARNIKADEKH